MNIEHSTSNIEHRTKGGARCNVRCSMFGVEYSMF